jgi:hypothetical protein
MTCKNGETAVLVTTQHRGVFFGYLAAGVDHSSRQLTLLRCRNAIYWSGTRGFLGLASHGPEGNSLVGAEATSVLLHDVTSVAECSGPAVETWENWSNA